MNTSDKMAENATPRNLKGHLLYGLFVLTALTVCDLVYAGVNPDYKFRIPELVSFGYATVFYVLIVVSFFGTWWRRLALLLIFAVTSMQWMSYQYFGTYIQPIQIIQLLPDLSLVARSLFEVLSEMYGIFCLMVSLAVVLIVIDRKFASHLKSSLMVSLFLIPMFAIQSVSVYRNLYPADDKIYSMFITRSYPGNDRLAVDNFYRSTVYLVYGLLPKMLSGAVNEAPALPKPEVQIPSPDVNVVFVINETVRASSLSILGYQGTNTTPYLEQIENLYAAPVYSAATMTRPVYLGVFNRLKHPWYGEQSKSHSNCLFKLAKENGFKTHFFYAYDRYATETVLPFMCAANIDEVRTTDDQPEELRKHDLSLFEELSNVNFDNSNFIVIGPMGAHSPYAANVPPDFNKTNSQYINSVLHTDYTMERLINIIKQRSTKPTIFIMTSDHGELLPGEDERRGHGWFHKEIYTVPFLYLPINTEADHLAGDVLNVRSHFDVSTLILRALGYGVSVEGNSNKLIFINSSDPYGLNGVVKVVIKDGEVVSETEIKNGASSPVSE